MIRRQLAEFRHPMRKIAKHAISESDEWRMQTDNARKPRLKAIAVEGGAPSIQGTPVVEEEDAKAIVSAIFAMRGANKKKHREALEQGAATCQQVAHARGNTGMEVGLGKR